jgi:hypothetical protein
VDEDASSGRWAGRPRLVGGQADVEERTARPSEEKTQEEEEDSAGSGLPNDRKEASSKARRGGQLRISTDGQIVTSSLVMASSVMS